MENLLELCARELMETAPKIVQAIRVEMRRARGADLSIPQFRSLRFIQQNPDSSLSHLADHLGLTLPSVSKLIDGLVRQELINRQGAITDRRRITLMLTPSGESIVNSARANAQTNLANTLGSLSDEDLKTIQRAMELLHPLFVSQGKPSPAKE
ncbi:MAG: MarR family transcriptional regulator [Chloroflexi bacterium]|nr:MarR family transcriptional regulator [Chloroflexota bacterium]